MAETLLAAFLGSKLAAATFLTSLDVLRGLRDRIEIAFTHAKKRTEALCDAADYASTYINLFGGHAEELDTFLGPGKRGELTRYLNKLQKAVLDAKQLVGVLQGKSTLAWIAKGESYRDALTDAANKIREATNELCQLYTGANLEVALSTNSQIAQLVKQLADQPRMVEPPIDPESEKVDPSLIDPNSLNRADYQELAGLTREAQQNFMNAAFKTLTSVKAETNNSIKVLGAANDRAKRSKLLVTRMATKVGVHGAAVEKCVHLQRRAIPGLAQSVSKAYNLVSNRDNVPARLLQIPTAQGVIADELGNFNAAWFAAEAAVQHLGHDDPRNRGDIQTAVMDMNQACTVFEDSVQTALNDFARDPNKKQDLLQGLRTCVTTLLNVTIRILEFERRELLVTAHKFVYSFPAAGIPAQLEATAANVNEADTLSEGNITPRTAPLEMSREDIEVEHQEFEYDVQDYGGPRIHNYDHVLETAKHHLEEFFTCDGRTVRFIPQKKITQQRMHGLLIDLQMLEVFANAWREKATQDLEEKVVDTLNGFVEVFKLSTSNSNGLAGDLEFIREMNAKVKDIHVMVHKEQIPPDTVTTTHRGDGEEKEPEQVYTDMY